MTYTTIAKWVAFWAALGFLMAALGGCAVIRDCTINACKGFH